MSSYLDLVQADCLVLLDAVVALVLVLGCGGWVGDGGGHLPIILSSSSVITISCHHRVVRPWQPAVAQVSRAETHCRVVIACSLEDMVSSEKVRQMICYHQGDGYHPSFLTSKQCWPTMQPSWLYSPCSQAPSQHRFHSTDFLLVWLASCHCHHGVMSCYCCVIY